MADNENDSLGINFWVSFVGTQQIINCKLTDKFAFSFEIENLKSNFYIFLFLDFV